MPVNHKERIKEKLIKDINGFWIMNTSKEEFIKEIQESITDDPNDQFYKQMLKDGYYENQIKKLFIKDTFSKLTPDNIEDILKKGGKNMKIYNTLTKKIEDFIPHNENKVKMYTCGPTV